MRLVIATPLYPPEIGGPATYVRELENGLPARGIEVITIKFSDVRHLPKVVRHYVYYRKVLAALKTADAVLALDPVSVGLPAMKAAQKLKKPFVVKIAGDYAWEQGVQRFGVKENLDEFIKTNQPAFFVKKLQRAQLEVGKNADKVIVPSPYLKEVVAQWGIPEEKVTVIYNGVEIPPSIPVPQKKEGEFLVVSAGRRVPWKGFEALERIGSRHSDWRVYIASGLPRTETLGWMKAADLFVLNSEYEGFPHTLIEAMSVGTPVVATDIGGNRAVITDGTTGVLVPPGDDSALEKAIAMVQNEPQAARERARAAQKRMEEFSLPRMLDATAHILTSL